MVASASFTTKWLPLMSLLLLSASACQNDMNCSLNGKCVAGTCSCDPGWTGSSCGQLDIKPAPPGGIYGFGQPFKTTTWGGNAIYDNKTALWHLFVTEMAGDGCGLHVWGSQSTVTHATSPNATGPFTKVSTALGHEAHNPQTILIDGKWYIFHIGTANSQKPAGSCNETIGPNHIQNTQRVQRSVKKSCPLAPSTFKLYDNSCISPDNCTNTHCNCGATLAVGDCNGTADACVTAGAQSCLADPKCHSFTVIGGCDGTSPNRWATHAEGSNGVVANGDWTAYVKPGQAPPPPPTPPPTVGGTIHTSTSPYGPWEALESSVHCNNPSPFLHPNGTLFLACTWTLQHSTLPVGSPGWETSWSAPIQVKSKNGSRPNGSWEDPFLFIDRRGRFHILSHVYTLEPYPENPVSGHAFSEDGLSWTFSEEQPYTYEVEREGGTTESFSTLERPKLFWGDASDPYRPTHITNGACPYWGSNVTDPCYECIHCSRCKVTTTFRGDAFNTDWTYTLVRPIN